MPPKKKNVEDPVKHYGEQSIREDFVPVDESDLAGAVDVLVKSRDNIETIENKPFSEKVSKTKVKKTKTNKPKSKPTKKNGKSWTEKFKPVNNKP